jgi:pyruvate/2-oxoglutarate dehydrogenase complex dihydrolipoamide acyltransferase (E2) component
MTMIAYEALSAQELVQTYNSFAAQLGVPEVTSKFSSKALGIKRCQKLEEQLQTWESQGNGQADEFEAQEEPAQEEPAQEEPAQEEPAQEEPAQEEPAQEEPAQEEPAQEDDLSLSDDPKEAASQLHAFFGDPELPSPEEQRAQAQEAKLKAPKVQSESPAERIQVDVSDPEAVFKAFKVREGTNKHRLLTAMIHAMGQSLSLSTMLKAAYGMEGVGDEGSLMMIVKGITVAITKNGLPFEVRKTRVVKVLHLALIHLEPEQESEA